MYKLLSELTILKEEQEMDKVYPLFESVETLLKNLVKKMESNPENFLEHIDVPQLAPQLAGLMLLGKGENRSSFEDFEPLEDVNGKKLSKKFYQFLSDIDEQHGDKVFGEAGEKTTANKFLHTIGTVHAKSLTDEWTKILEAAKTGVAWAVEKIKVAITKLHEFYTSIYKKLTDAFYDRQGNAAFGTQEQPTAVGSGIDDSLANLNVEM
jgi:hypothetical protein